MRTDRRFNSASFLFSYRPDYSNLTYYSRDGGGKVGIPPHGSAYKIAPCFDFFKLNYIYNRHYANNNNNKNYSRMKRQWRNDMQQAQKDKIAQANTGKVLSPETRRRISQSMTKYWAGLPFKPTDATGGTSTEDTNPY